MRRSAVVAGAVTLAVLLAACTGGDAVPGPTTSSTATASAAAAAQVEPVVVEALLGGEQVAVEVGPFALHGDVGVLRIAAPTPPSTLSLALWHVFDFHASPGPNGVRLVDADAGTVTSVLTTTGGRPLATGNSSPGGPRTDAAVAAADGAEVVHAAFPAVDDDTVDVLLPQVGWVRDVPVVAAEAAGDLTVPPSELSDQPAGEAVTAPVETYTEALSGQVRTRRTADEVEVAVSSDVLFAFDSDQLAPEADAALQSAAAQVAAHGGGNLTVVGHTDDQGDETYNVDLSQRRAQTVATRLGELVDLSAFDLAVEGRGESEPLVAGTGDAERALNRRVALVLVPSSDPAETTEVVVDAGALPDPQGAVAAGATGVSVTDGDATFDVRLPEVRRVGRYLVGALEVTNTGATDLALGSLAVGAWDARGSLDAELQFAPTNVTLVSGGTRLYPVDYVKDAERGARDPLSDRIVNGVAPGTVRTVTVVWPDTGEDVVTLDVAPRFHPGNAELRIAGRAPFRLTDVPVVED